MKMCHGSYFLSSVKNAYSLVMKMSLYLLEILGF
jgi:hypothetical protein